MFPAEAHDMIVVPPASLTLFEFKNSVYSSIKSLS